MYGIQNKWCFVPNCNSTSTKDPDKKFLSLPQNFSRRMEWFKAAKRDLPKTKSTFFCCEDHFDLEKDMENYIRYKLMGGKIKLKDGVVPHIFECQNRKVEAASSPEQPPLMEETLIWVGNEINYSQSGFSTTAILVELPTASLCQIGPEAVARTQNIAKVVQTRSVGVQVKPHFRSKYVTCQVKPTFRSKYVMCKMNRRKSKRRKYTKKLN